ncbi:YtxH domain-containing protein [Mucilaginibacter agri]|uniref:YtxH domain-containing protein n=1 Tax=Mucilaginibacter agri TaxID=2695265 RepID=A0A965ZC96_9SPHI|nr:YtxH domain-containing protein [Mucilaginibacter agri]NCD68373.1 YtxH domain-containing protein [Mucilaginibacter agri]
MNHFKTFLLGIATAFGIYYITKKRDDGSSLLDDILENPSDVANKAKDIVIDQAVESIKCKLT